jgi:hypothetical protein
MEMYVHVFLLQMVLFICFIYLKDNGYIRASGNKLTGKTFRFDLNPDHTHFIIYNEKNNSEQMNYNSFRNRLESLFTKSLSHYKRVLASSMFFL